MVAIRLLCVSLPTIIRNLSKSCSMYLLSKFFLYFYSETESILFKKTLSKSLRRDLSFDSKSSTTNLVRMLAHSACGEHTGAILWGTVLLAGLAWTLTAAVRLHPCRQHHRLVFRYQRGERMIVVLVIDTLPKVKFWECCSRKQRSRNQTCSEFL